MPRTMLKALLAVLLFAGVYAGGQQAAAAEYEAKPDTLRALLTSTSPVLPGDTIWLTKGTYRGLFRSAIHGTAERPILIRARRGQEVTFDGNIQIFGAYTHWWGFEVTNTLPDRSQRGTGIEVNNAGTKLINLTIHDCGQGIGSWSWPDCEIYGCIIYQNGYVATDRNHGHGLYVQNATGTKHIEDNILTAGLGYGIHAYGQQGILNGLVFKGNWSYANQMTNFHVGGTKLPINKLTCLENIAMGYSLGYSARNNQGLIFKDNVCINGQVQLRNWIDGITFTDNTIITTGRILTFNPTSLDNMPRYPVAAWNNNRYIVGGNSYFATDGLTYYNTLNKWQAATNWDKESVQMVRTDEAPPQVWLRKNRYEEGRCHIAVYAPGQTKQRVRVNISRIVTTGQAYAVYHIPDLKTPVLTGTSSGIIALPPSEKAFSTYLVITK